MAGNQAGADEGSGTRSSLMYETLRIVEKLKPKYVIWENVKNLISDKHLHNFNRYIDKMKSLGYKNYYDVLNAKDYGVPQNRERVFTVSIRNDIEPEVYYFPEKQELKLRLKDMLEDEVEEKYYLSDAQIERIKKTTYNAGKTRIQKKDYCGILCARDWKDPKCIQVGELDIKGHDSIKRVYSQEGISPTLTDMQGGNRQPKIITYNVLQTVKVRKYFVDIEKLKETLRDAKVQSDLTNSRLAFELEVPITTVEHWFRKDNCFSIPEPEIWFDLKSLLNITTTEFDESIMTFEEKDGVYDKANRIYDEQGLAPTLTQQEEKILIKNATKKSYDEAIERDSINLQFPNSKTRRGRVGHQATQTLQCNDSIGVVEKTVKLGQMHVQQIEISGREIANSTTTVQKDNYVLEPKLKYLGSIKDKDIVGDGKQNLSRNSSVGDRVYDSDGISTTITAEGGGVGGNSGLYAFRSNSMKIRKLTPLECWRLMGFDDEDYYKAEKVNSNIQLYKQAGNSIVVNVLEVILANLFETERKQTKKGIRLW